MTANNTCNAFAPRPIEFTGLRSVNGWQLKTYSITLPGEPFDATPYDAGFLLAGDALPQPPVATGRFGVGFAILHQISNIDYLVLGWWGRENELPIRVFIRDRSESSAQWREAQGDESFCVWDAEIIWHERNAWVKTVLASEGTADVDGYLAAVLNSEALSSSPTGRG